MRDYDITTFGKLHADEYDELHDPGTTTQAVGLLAELIGNNRALELAIGTGRVALPLAERGLDIQGLDASPEMIAMLRDKPMGDQIPVTMADMSDFKIDHSFDFAFLIFNTLFNLTSQEAQVSCFQSVSKHLKKGGAFLIETFVPDLTRFTDGRSLQIKDLDFGSVTLEAAKHDPVAQIIEYQSVRITENRTTLLPLPMRYAWPAEIDLMARLAGLGLENRWGGWDRSPFTGDSKMHVSLYRKAN